MRRSDAASSVLCFKRGSFVVLSVCVPNGASRASAHIHTDTHTYRIGGSSPVCPPFVILSEANHVRQGWPYLCMRKIVEAEMPIPKPDVL